MRQLEFGTLTKIGESLCEVIINAEVEMDLDMVTAYHNVIDSMFENKVGLLINKINPYTYTFEAQLELGKLSKIKGMAIWVHSKRSEISTQSVLDLPRDHTWVSQIFNERERAVDWLNTLIDTKQ